MQITKRDLLHAAIGGAAFWVPSTVLHAVKGAEFSFFHWWALGCVQPLTALATFIAMSFVRRSGTTARRCALSMLLGIWILGPSCIAINFTFDGGGFAYGSAWLDVLIATLLFPLLTPWLSAYDGSIIGLLVSSLLLGAASLDLRPSLSRKGWWPFSRSDSSARS